MYDPTLYRLIDDLPTLSESQADDLKIDTRTLSVATDLPAGVDGILVWTHRPTSGHVMAERYVNGTYHNSDEDTEADDIAAAVAAARLDGLLD